MQEKIGRAMDKIGSTLNLEGRDIPLAFVYHEVRDDKTMMGCALIHANRPDAATHA